MSQNTTIETTVPLIILGFLILIMIWLFAREIRTPKRYGLQKDVDLRLTYKRYIQIYPSADITYQEYKKMQVERAYKKAVSSTKIKRMVR